MGDVAGSLYCLAGLFEDKSLFIALPGKKRQKLVGLSALQSMMSRFQSFFKRQNSWSSLAGDGLFCFDKKSSRDYASKTLSLLLQNFFRHSQPTTRKPASERVKKTT